METGLFGFSKSCRARFTQKSGQNKRLYDAQPTVSSCPGGSRDPADQGEAGQKVEQFLREAERTKMQIEKLEKERTLSVQCKKNNWSDVSGELEGYEKMLEEERYMQKRNLQNQLANIHSGVRKFQKQLSDVKPTAALIERLKEIMSEVEISINNLKREQHTCFELLFREERMCAQEIAAFEKKIENWSFTIKFDLKRTATATVKTKPFDRNLPTEVRALESFLQHSGGPCGGWEQCDHETFLQLWTRHSGQPVYRKQAQMHLPGKTPEEIKLHEDWHRELIRLQDRKREAIQRWKATKQLGRQGKILETEEEKGIRTDLKGQRLRAEEERRLVAQRLDEWKAAKKKKAEEEEEQKQAEEIQKSRQAKEQRRRQLRVKMVVEEQLRLKREEEEEQRRIRTEEKEKWMDERRKKAAKEIKHFSERDLHKVQVKLQEKQLKEKEEEERQDRISAKLKERVDGRISRDPSRITRPTRGWEERLKNIGPTGGGRVEEMFHSAVPSWRQGL